MLDNNDSKNTMHNWRSRLAKMDAIQISGIGLVAYILMAILLVVAIQTHTLPNTMIGAILV